MVSENLPIPNYFIDSVLDCYPDWDIKMGVASGIPVSTRAVKGSQVLLVVQLSRSVDMRNSEGGCLLAGIMLLALLAAGYYLF